MVKKFVAGRPICKCGTTMEDIEQARFSVFGDCKSCLKFATACWQFATACVPEQAEKWFLEGMANDIKARKSN